MFYIQFYRRSPSGEIVPERASWGWVDINPDALQWEIEEMARGLSKILLHCVGFALFERHPDGTSTRLSKRMMTGGLGA